MAIRLGSDLTGQVPQRRDRDLYCRRQDAQRIRHRESRLLPALGAFCYVGFLIVNLPYSLLLALFVALMNMIPYIGPIIGAIPCLLIAFTDSYTSAVWVLVIILIAQQLEGNLISPMVYVRTMDIHPLTTIVVVLIAGAISGIIGFMISIPVYMIGKIIVLQIAEHYERKTQPNGNLG